MKKLLTLFLALATSVVMMNAVETIEIDFRNGEYTLIAPATLPAGVVVAGTARNDVHGYDNVVLTVPVEAGNYSLTVGACSFGNGSGSVTNEAGTVEYATFNQKKGDNMCYHQNPAANIVKVTFSISEAQTIKIICGQYTPYIKLEKVETLIYTITYANAVGATGIVPAALEVVDGEYITLPINHTLYKEGYTLTGWNDGYQIHDPNTSFHPNANTTMTAVFTQNTVTLNDRTSEMTVKWSFSQAEGVPSVSWEGGNNGFLVGQAIVNETPLDVQLSIATGKFANSGRTDEWAQVNTNTVFSFPAKQGMTIEAYTYSAPSIAVNGVPYTGEWAEKKVVFQYNGTDEVISLSNLSDNYYSYIKAIYPAPESTAIDNTVVTEKATKRLVNGLLLIEHNGKTYNATGVRVR